MQGQKKRFYNSMVVSGLVGETQPKVVSQSTHHAKESRGSSTKFSIIDEAIMQISNRAAANVQINKQLSQSNEGGTFVSTTPHRRASR